MAGHGGKARRESTVDAYANLRKETGGKRREGRDGREDELQDEASLEQKTWMYSRHAATVPICIVLEH